MKLILASKSLFRAEMLKNAGIVFETETSRIDERFVERPLIEANIPPADIAEVLAIAKAEDVSGRNPSVMVIGSDQVLELEGQLLHKPDDMEAARRRLLALSEKTHLLHTSVVLVKDGETLWSHVETAKVTFRRLSPTFVGKHLAEVGEIALSSVGAYQIEGRGVQLIEKIEGDFFTVMGMALLPLLSHLRSLQILES